MRTRKLLAVALSLALTLSTAAGAAAQDIRDFVIQNASVSEVTELWVAASDSETWGEQILSTPIPALGGMREIVFPYPAPGVCLYWVHATHADGETSELRDVDLCQTFLITITDTEIFAS